MSSGNLRQAQVLKPMLLPDKPRGRKRRVDLREVINAIPESSSGQASICCERAVHGACCHMISRLGRPSMAISTVGATASCLATSTPPYASRCAWLRGAMQPLRQPSSTRNRSRQPSTSSGEQGGDRGVACPELDSGTQARRSTGANVILSLTRWGCCCGRWFTAPAYRGFDKLSRDGAKLVLAAIKSLPPA